MRIEVRRHVMQPKRPWTAVLLDDVPLMAFGRSPQAAIGRLYQKAAAMGLAGAGLVELPPYDPPKPPPPPEPLMYVI